MTTAVVLQSNYIPWRGYFDLINDCDLFIFYDCVQFTTGDWRNRNIVKTSQGPQWLTVPVGSKSGRTIAEVAVPNSDWQRKHLKTIEQAYIRSACFSSHMPFVREIYLRDWKNLSEMNQWIISKISRDILGCKTPFANSTEFSPQGSSNERLISVLKGAGVTRYISGPAAKSYLDEEMFAAAGISVVWKDYSGYPEYVQPHGPFDGKVSIIDLILNAGDRSNEFIWGWRRSAAP